MDSLHDYNITPGYKNLKTKCHYRSYSNFTLFFQFKMIIR